MTARSTLVRLPGLQQGARRFVLPVGTETS